MHLLQRGEKKKRGGDIFPRTHGSLSIQRELYICENHVRELRTFFTVVLEPNIHTFSVLSETLQDFLKSKLCYTPANSLLNTELRSLNRTLTGSLLKQTQWLSILSKNKQNKETPGQHSLLPSSRRSTPTRPNFHTPSCRSAKEVKLQALLI